MFSKAEYYNPEAAEYLNPETKRRVAIVTGGNSGLGWYTALHLYLHGYVVYIAGRTESKVQKAIQEIKEEAEKRRESYTDEQKASRYVGSLTFIHFDCCDLKSVEKCAQEFSDRERKLHILINNAGLMGVPFELTKDGYEIQYQVNFVAPFLFTLKLLPLLKDTTTDSEPSRVICLSSVGHTAAKSYYSPTDNLNKKPNFFYTWIRYGNAKTAEIQFMKKLAEVCPDILSFSVHPGVIVDTQLFNYWKNLRFVGPFAKLGMRFTSTVIGVTQEEGCLATLRAALDKSLSKKDNGAYIETGGVFGRPSKVASSQEYANKLWTENLELLKTKGFNVDLES
ncbi:short chain dehydrogenase family protein [Clavispora lusitaniae]|uniref:short chain dehydrogenase family protein n=1 Tax=Clavispora lusitaniae TaxID=36911 RepID=UPI00202C8329|nr:short chain dehydrogenase family protein [Clavispora lusitaniae]